MSISMRVEDPQLDPGRVQLLEELLVRLVGTFEILAGGRVLYSETAFPFLELGVALRRWLSNGLPDGTDFEFDSMSAAEPGLVWIRLDRTGWRVGSTEQEFPSSEHLSNTEVSQMIEGYIGAIRDLVPPEVAWLSDAALGAAP